MKKAISPPGRRTRNKRGFSLIISLLLLVLLTVVAIGFLSLSTISLRSAEEGNATATARANAWLAITMALGELQKYAGPDQRATATSDQLSMTARRSSSARTESVNQKNWLGVWPTVQASTSKPGFLVGRYDSGDSSNWLVDLREPTTPNSGDSAFDSSRSNFSDAGNLTWLVSAPSGNTKDLSPKSFTKSGDSVVIYGQGWETDSRWKDSQVSVPLVNVSSGSPAAGRYGFWVEDDNMKSNLAVVSRHGSSGTAKTIAQTAPIDLVDATKLRGHQAMLRSQSDDLKKLVSYDTTGLISVADPAMLARYYRSAFTAQSTGLLTNPQMGGFQQDLSAFLALPGSVTETGYTPATGFSADSTSGAPGLKIGDPIVQGSRHTNTSPRFGALKAWADLAKLVNGSGAAASIEIQRSPSRAGDSYSTAGYLPDITKVGPQAVHPIMTECSLGWDFTDLNTTNPHGLRVHIYPKVVLWNPYNVTLKSASYLVMMKPPYYSNLTINGKPTVNGGTGSFDFTKAFGYSMPRDATMCFVTEATEIPPGQALVFTASAIGRADALSGYAMKYSKNYSENILTCRQNPEKPYNFYRELVPGITDPLNQISHLVFSHNETITDSQGNVKIVPVYDKIPGIAADYEASYGFPGDSNGFYAGAGACNDQYILKALPNNKIPSSLSLSMVDNSADYPALQYMIAQTAATKIYDKWWSALRNDHPSNASPAFGPFSASSCPPRLWRRGLKLRWFDDSKEYAALNQPARGTSPFNVNWTSEYNLRAGLVHTAWLGSNGVYDRVNGANGGTWKAGDPGPYVFMWSPLKINDGTNRPIVSGGNYCTSPFGTTQSTGDTTSFPFFEVPRSGESIVSLAQFQNAQLSYQTYHTSYVVAHSEQEPRSERAATVVRPGNGGTVTAFANDDIDNVNIWNTGHDILIQNQNKEILLYDMPFEVNHRLFDNYFLSGITSGWDTKSALPNDRLRVLTSLARTSSQIKSKMGDDSYRFHQAGTFLGNEGAFNVNSTSVAAWTAHLSGLRDLARDAVNGSASGGSWYYRMQNPVLASDSTGADTKSAAGWAGVAALSDANLSKLATAMVDEVKLRGPFISLSDFVNRRLVAPPSNVRSILYEDPNAYSLETSGKIGTLGAAIIRAGLNAGIGTTPNPSAPVASRFASNERDFTKDDVDSGYYVFGAQPNQKTSGLSGSLTQGDLLCALAPTLTARGDTFTIRGYGEARNSSGTQVLAKAWCEVTVQRVPDYVDSTNDPSVRPLIPASSDSSDPMLKKNPVLTEVNRCFGRKFDIISFQWLNESEI